MALEQMALDQERSMAAVRNVVVDRLRAMLGTNRDMSGGEEKLHWRKFMITE